LHERSYSDWLNDQSSYTYLYGGAVEINSRNALITSVQSITTSASIAEYNLNPDFTSLYLKDKDGKYFVKVYDGTNYFFVNHKAYEEVYYNNLTSSQTMPDSFTIKPATTQDSNITGTASSAGTASNGEATLTDTSSSTKFSTISVGDTVHNTTDSSHGIVIEKTSNTALICAMFSSTGSSASFESSDAYVIVPQPRYSMVFEPAFSTSGYVVAVPYIQKPTPVFSPYRSYKFPMECKRELVDYAATLYKYRDRDPNFGNAFFQFYDRGTKLNGGMNKKAINSNTFKMNLMKRK
jgi:hypothetical protein